MTTSLYVCRFCRAPLSLTLVDLGVTPLANSYLPDAAAAAREQGFPLHARVCTACRLVQVEDVSTPDHIFGHYAYFSSFSASWLKHCERYADTAIARFGLSAASKVVEIASNDGYLLQYFIRRGVPALGVEPAANVAEVAVKAGVPTEVAFFGLATADRLAASGHSADLMCANNVLAHVPDINDFTAGFARLLKPEGVMSVEFPHLLRMLEGVQFDTIYHEHYSYLSLLAVERIFAANGLRVFDVEELPTHGGSLRVWACRADADVRREGKGLAKVRADEATGGLDRDDAYLGFDAKARRLRDDLLAFLEGARRDGKRVAVYGAAAKGNTLLNYCRIGADRIDFAVDLNPHKQGTLLPGSHVPVRSPEHVFEARPDYLLILPWNLKDEITLQMAGIRDWGGKFVVAVPHLTVF
ncbi:MAG: methyltransferase domain-containing protein [Beijerinckiaceae bacterium]